MKFKKQIPYEILITPTVNGGFLVNCGCVVTVYANHNDLIRDLEEYLGHPTAVESQYNVDIALSGVQTQPPISGNTASEMNRQRNDHLKNLQKKEPANENL